MKSIIRRHPAAAYIVLAFVPTWAIAFFMLFSGLADDVANPSPLFILCGIFSNIFPSLSALLVTYITNGREGIRRLVGGIRVKSRRGFLLLTAAIVPGVTVLTTLTSHLFFHEYRFSLTAPMIAMGLVWPLFSGMGEEFGWRGFLLPRLIRRLGLIKAAAVVGIIWEVWHLPMHYMAYRAFGAYMIPAFLTVGFLNLTLCAVIMAMIYALNRGSLKLMVLYHYTITASSILLGALFVAESSPRFTVLESLVSCALYLAVAVVLFKKNRATLTVFQKEAGPDHFPAM